MLCLPVREKYKTYAMLEFINILCGWSWIYDLTRNLPTKPNHFYPEVEFTFVSRTEWLVSATDKLFLINSLSYTYSWLQAKSIFEKYFQSKRKISQVPVSSSPGSNFLFKNSSSVQNANSNTRAGQVVLFLLYSNYCIFATVLPTKYTVYSTVNRASGCMLIGWQYSAAKSHHPIRNWQLTPRGRNGGGGGM